MFSGIVEETGVVDNIDKKKNLHVLHIRSAKVHRGVKQGDSIAVNGVCLTVTQIRKNILTFDVMLETLRKTTLGQAVQGTRVNLERSLKVNDRLGGHFVSGHVDDTGTIRKIVTDANYVEIQVNVSPQIRRYIAAKGSVALDGVSLTIGDVRARFFSVYLIPYTLEVTNLSDKKKGDLINVETDILAKYVLNAEKYSVYSYSKNK